MSTKAIPSGDPVPLKKIILSKCHLQGHKICSKISPISTSICMNPLPVGFGFILSMDYECFILSPW
jgi:hypothetical protein